MKNQQNSDQPIHTALLILGAGNSSRLGRPKQLLGMKNTTLLNHTLQEALKVSCQVRVLVLGAYQKEIQAKITPTDTEILFNKNWENGMASSIQVGLNWLIDHYDPDQVLILLCDQPFVDQKLLEKLISQKSNVKKGIVGSAYAGTVGVPVLFERKYFPELLALKGKEGAKKLLKKFGEDVGSINFPKGNVDIDTETDFDAYMKEDWNYFEEKKD
ncbi:nucleotidyltransferase family protein [Lunatibacter salilacus]|uniref:nucleotidyltransferase family protein n=1 Tax=Lunatibacter salilacus TaxID=2483804 RepID=UPI00131CBA1B|nr:nucleotidyltransferase family protein [Lunatibacter salilacus]